MNKVGTAYMNWSGGKDSSLCLHHVLQEGRHQVNCLLTSVNAHHNRISMHGVRRELLETQAIFGDIFLEDLKKYREEKLATLGIECLFPLWKIPTIELMREFIGLGFKAIIVCVNEKFLDSSFCGREIDELFLADLPANVDPCGEHGEYHSFVYEGPVFKYPIPFQKGDIVRRQYASPVGTTNNDSVGFYFADLLPVT